MFAQSQIRKVISKSLEQPAAPVRLLRSDPCRVLRRNGPFEIAVAYLVTSVVIGKSYGEIELAAYGVAYFFTEGLRYSRIDLA